MSSRGKIVYIIPQGGVRGAGRRMAEQGLTPGVGPGQVHKRPEDVFASACGRIRQLLSRINKELEWDPNSPESRIPHPDVMKTPQTLFLEKMFRRTNWPDMPSLKKKQEEERNKGLSVDFGLLNSFIVDGPADGPWTITVDGLRAMNLESACRQELKAVGAWMREHVLQLYSVECDIKGEWTPLPKMVGDAHEGLGEWFDVLFESVRQGWHDAMSDGTSEIDVDEDAWTQGTGNPSSCKNSQPTSMTFTIVTANGTLKAMTTEEIMSSLAKVYGKFSQR
jgi:hypothetical protein